MHEICNFLCLIHVDDWQLIYQFTINKSNESKHRAAYKIILEINGGQMQSCIESPPGLCEFLLY